MSDVDGVKQLYKTAFKGKICSSLSAKNLLMRELEFQSNSSKHLEQIIAFQADATSHLSETDVLAIPYIIEHTKEKTTALLFTAARSGIREQLEVLKKIQIDPDSITATPVALIHFLKWKFPHLKDAILVDLGSEEWTCVCIDKGNLKKFHSIPGGIESLLEALWEDRKKILIPKEITGIAKQIDLLQLQLGLNSQLSALVFEFRKEFARVIYSFSSHYGQKPIFFTGRIDAFGQLQEFLEESIADVVSPNLTEEMTKDEQKHAISIGLTIGYGQKSVQFLQDEFFPKKNWRKLGLASLYLGAASLLFSLGLVGFSNYTLHSNNQKMISSLKSTLNDWDRSLARDMFATNQEEEILERWNKAIRRNSKEYAYIMQNPKVAEILSWIYQHPCISGTEKDQDPIEIHTIRYQLVSYPNIDSPKEPYLAKIEMEFKTASPLNARKFHESIYQGEGWADNSQDIQWEATENLYRISFHLRNEKNA
ncbi:MAG TPA: hypothetical protein VLE96_00345 [Chlamydiales bacterium]|nr:hypothetical protein [Chlamydiales bacterium]